MLPLLFILAETTFTGEQVTTLLLAVVAALGGGGILGKKFSDARRITVDPPQPLMVKMQEEFVTRREFERLEASMGTAATEMKGLFQQTMQAVSAQNTTLTKKIENQGERLMKSIQESNTSHQTARGRIHTKVNAQGELLAALTTKVSVSDDIKALAETIVTEIRGGQDAQ